MAREGDKKTNVDICCKKIYITKERASKKKMLLNPKMVLFLKGDSRMLKLSLLMFVFLSLAVAVICVDEYSKEDFPRGFVFGAGTSAYQVEGAVNEDGRSPSVFDTFTHQGGAHGQTGDVAVDQYHKYKEDVQLMVQTGLDAYRFSISWPRLIPNGRGPVNPKGVQYYNNLINELVRNGIQPHVTLFHYDLPQLLEDEYRGWLSRRIVDDFTAYVDVCFREFGDRVKHWTTLNEPNALALFAYGAGMLPPSRCSPPLSQFFNCSAGNSSTEPYLVAHHAVLAHASAARLYKNKYQAKQDGLIGCSALTFGIVPSTNSSEDLMAAQRANDFLIGLIMHPIVHGDYPETVKRNAGSRLPVFTDQEAKLVKGSFDFLGLIHYTGMEVKDSPDRLNSEPRDVFSDMATSLFFSDSNMSKGSLTQYPITPSSIQTDLNYFKQTYGNPPIYILENGQVNPQNASIEDHSRVDYLRAYIGSVLDAIREGSNVKGYFVWSFMDVFELMFGWDVSFGLYYVDLDDQELTRYPKLSAQWYADFLKGERVSLDAAIGLQNETSSLILSRVQ